MSSSRYNPTGRDFLQENKQKISHWESNGRMTTAASAKRIPLWRPVVLHYTEKLRPHAQQNQGRGRSSAGAHESAKKRSGLAQPYGFTCDDRALQPPSASEQARRQQQKDEELKDQGGWSDQLDQPQQQTQTQTEDIKDSRFLNKALNKCRQCEIGDNVSQSVSKTSKAQRCQEDDNQSQCSTMSKVSKKSKAPQCPEGDNQSQCSRMSRVSKTSKASRRLEGDNLSQCSKTSKPSRRLEGGDAEMEAPLSARSSASVKTIVSQNSLKSTHTVHTQATVKSQAASKPQSEMEGYTQLTDNERRSTLEEAHHRYAKLTEEYNHLPVYESTLRVRNRKMVIERELDELNYTISMFDQPHIKMYYKH